MTSNKSLHIITVLLPVLLFLPGFLITFFPVGSLSSGVFIASILTLTLSCVFKDRKFHNIDLYFCLVLIAIIFVSFHYLFAMKILEESVDVPRSVFSVFFLFIFLSSAVLFSFFLESVSQRDFFNLIVSLFHVMLLVLTFSSLLHFFGYNPKKEMFFFKEPSHFALIFGPFLAFYSLVASSILKKFLVLIFVSILAVLIMNLTLLIAVAISALLSFRLNFRFVILFVTSLGLFLYVMFQFFPDSLSYFSSRLNFSSDNDNLSFLVYASGIERLYLSMVHTGYFGLGFQNLGYVGPDGEFMNVISDIVGIRLNFNDGGFVIAKFVSEFGIFGICFILIYVLFSIIVVLRPKKTFVDKFCFCVLILFSVELFVRGAGYFTPGTYIFFASMFFLARNVVLKKIS